MPFIDIKILFKIAVIAVLGLSCHPKSIELAKAVNPFIGTGGHGHTYPGVSMPFGMVQLSPDTRVYGWDACSGYHYSDSTIMGFSHTHLSGTGAADYGDILITPVTTNTNDPIGFSHVNEKAWAGYYEVKLENNVDVRLTTTTRVGIHEYTFASSDSAKVNINLNHGIGPDHTTEANWRKVSENQIAGYRRSSGWAKDQIIYFVAQFSADFNILSNKVDSLNITLAFNRLDNPLLIKVGISAVSEENALKNLELEAPHWNFNEYQFAAERTWQSELGKIKGDFLTEDDRIIFYTALYHSFLAPNTFSDKNGEYRGLDDAIHYNNKTHYSVFSLWDTFRAAHPLFTILNPQRNVDMINAMLTMYEESGLLPVWELAANETGTMIGYHSIPVIADAIIKNEPGFDYQLALEAMVNSAMQNKLGLEEYRSSGYISSEKEHESVSKTLEYAYDDWCIAQVAEVLGEDSIYQVFINRSQYYKNLFDPSTGFMRPKRNGNWLKEFDPYEVSGNYTEANAWQYSYFVPHDISGLADLYGSDSAFIKQIDLLFTTDSKVTGRNQPDIDGMIGQYAHGNEPSHNFAYLYNYMGQPWKTQALVRRILTELYTNEPDGLSGNEDCGQMSAWYVFSALGLYPALPGSNQYLIGTPMLKRANVHLANENLFKMTANELSNENKYIQSVTLNGIPLQRSYLAHEEIVKGGNLIFNMGPEPAKEWNNKKIKTPVSKVEASAIANSPTISGGEMTFIDSANINIAGFDVEDRIYYTVDNTIPDTSSILYQSTFSIDSTCLVRAVAYNSEDTRSGIAEARFIKIPYGRSIELENRYSHFYTGNSEMALIDHIKGGSNFRDGWQGFHEVDLVAIVDLGSSKTISEVNVGFLQDQYSWIFYPEWLEISFSKNGKSFYSSQRLLNEISSREDGLITQTIGSEFQKIEARYIKVTAKNLGKCPDWHKGAGDKAWLFADEIEIITIEDKFDK